MTTPGPWKAVKFKDTKSTTIQGGEYFAAIGNFKSEADATLAAAAPEMLEALELAEANMLADLEEVGYGPDDAAEYPALAAVRAAIAKAKGTP